MQTNVTKLLRERLAAARGELFSPAQAAEILGISVRKAQAEVASGRLPATDVNAGRPPALWRVARADIAERIRRMEAQA